MRLRGPAQGLASWTPAELGSSLVLWLRADLGNTAPDDGVWMDQSGNGYNTSQGVAANRPTLVSDWKNGKPALDFDGSNDVLVNASGAILANGAAYSLFVVGAKDIDPDTNAYNDQLFRIVGTAFHKHQMMQVGGQRYVAGTNILDVTVGDPFGIATDPFYASWIEQGDDDSSTVAFRANGVDIATATELNDLATVTGYQVGGASSSFYNGKIGEVILVSGAVDDATRDKIEQYIIGFWGAF